MPPKPPKRKAPHLQQGETAEDTAHHYLIRQGLKPLQRNFRCQQGELDLVMLDQNVLVIAEVRFRKSDRYGSAAESVTPAKQSRIIAATHVYLARHPQDRAIRFDVVALSGDGRIAWIKNAF